MSPRSERVVDVFVASPSDMEPERERLDEVITKLNGFWTGEPQVRLNLVRWETHSVPGVGTDPQDVLNNELAPEDADVFIGLMWGRFGTPTSKAGSGTEEEFERALVRHHENQKSIQIMFYFKEASLPLDQIDPKQFCAVQKFKSSLGDKGVLYGSFPDIDNFERQVTFHLSNQIKYFQKQHGGSVPHTKPPAVDAELDPDEPGLLDYLVIVDGNFGSLIEVASHICSDTEAVGKRITRRAREIEVATAVQAPHPMEPIQAQYLVNNAASDLMTYVARMKAAIPLFDQQLKDGTKAASQAILIAMEITPNNEQELMDTLQKMSNLNDSIGLAHEAMTSFRNSVLSLPKMTAKLNRAKRETASVIQQFINSMKSARETITVTTQILKD